MKTIAIIPARGGSKGVPGKNILPIGGKPLLAWNIQAASQSRFVDEVYVSTDDEQIRFISQQYGAKVIERPSELAGDYSSSESALLHALTYLYGQGVHPEILVFMQCTSPLTTADDIDQAVQRLVEEEADSCFTASEFHGFVWCSQDNGTTVGVNHDKAFRPRRQDRESQFLENGAIYVMKVGGFMEAKHRFFGKTIMSEMPRRRSVEIDDWVDVDITETLLKSIDHIPASLTEPEGVGNSGAYAFPKAVLFDFDGVFTDNKVYLDERGRESVRCDRSDGWGIAQLKKHDIRIAVLSTEKNPVVAARCEKLDIECYHGLGEKKYEAFVSWCAENGLETDAVWFVGNDLNDMKCLQASGRGIIPSDAHEDMFLIADHVLRSSGGKGAVREVCDFLLKMIGGGNGGNCKRH